MHITNILYREISTTTEQKIQIYGEREIKIEYKFPREIGYVKQTPFAESGRLLRFRLLSLAARQSLHLLLHATFAITLSIHCGSLISISSPPGSLL